MSRARRHVASIPSRLLRPKLELQQASRTVPSELAVADPAPGPHLPINLELLNIRPALQPLCHNTHHTSRITQRDADILEPWRQNEVQRLSSNGVQPNHIPDEPRAHGASVIVPGDARGPVRVILVHDLAGPLHGLVLPLREVVIQEGRHEARLVPRVEDGGPGVVVALLGLGEALDEHGVQARLACFRPAHERHQRLHVEVEAHAVLPGDAFVCDGAPAALAACQGAVWLDRAVAVCRREEAGEVECCGIV